ncbi:MAG: helix-turn-helix domain-containing protein [Legionellales bacterium]|nr:helix-turn-helix domain-containing protein [Legionellales bacterium]
MVSKIEKLVQNSAKSLYDAGIIEITTMREFDLLKTKKIKSFSPKKIKQLRLQCRISQSVFAKLLNVSQSAIKQWEMGERKPNGAAVKLLNLIAERGIEAII